MAFICKRLKTNGKSNHQYNSAPMNSNLFIMNIYSIVVANKKHQNNQGERYQTTLQRQNGSSNASSTPTITQTFYPGNIASEQTHQNVSYHTTAPETSTNVNYTLQVPGVATTRVNISHRENESTLVYNHTHEDRGSGLYEELDYV